MKCLYLHNRRSSGPKESSWWTFHYILEELKKRNYLLGNYSYDFGLTDDNNVIINDKTINEADCLIMSFPHSEGPLFIAKNGKIPAFIEINYACPETVNLLMNNEINRLGFSAKELDHEPKAFGYNFYSKPTYIFGAGNSYTENSYKEIGLNNVKMFNAGIDSQFFAPNFLNRKSNDKIKFTFTCAVLSFRKGIHYLCDAWNKIPAEYHDKIELHIFGKRPTAPDTKRLFEDLLKKHKNIYEHGFISNQDSKYIKIHAEADAMICPTLAEGQSATALEGMSFGLYPIVSPFTGSDFTEIPGKNLGMDPSKWPEEICDGIKYVVDEYNTIIKIAPNIRKHAIENYSWNLYGKKIVDFMELEYKKFFKENK